MDGGVADTTCYYTGRLDGGGRGERHNPLPPTPTLAPKCVRYVDITDRCSRRGDRGVVAFNTMRAQPSGRGLTLAAARCARAAGGEKYRGRIGPRPSRLDRLE